MNSFNQVCDISKNIRKRMEQVEREGGNAKLFAKLFKDISEGGMPAGLSNAPSYNHLIGEAGMLKRMPRCVDIKEAIPPYEEALDIANKMGILKAGTPTSKYKDFFGFVRYAMNKGIELTPIVAEMYKIDKMIAFFLVIIIAIVKGAGESLASKGCCQIV